MRSGAVTAIRWYQKAVSPFLPVSCRYLPSCSEFSHEAITRYGLLRGLWLTARRLAKCTPIGGRGYDPVP